MDHTYDEFSDLKKDLDLENMSLKEQDELVAKLLSAADFLCAEDIENAEEVLIDVQELTEKNEE